jgi:hypothetical protein
VPMTIAQLGSLWWDRHLFIFIDELDHMLCSASELTLTPVQRWATDWTIGVLGFDSRRGLGIFLFTTVSRPALGPTLPPIQGVPGDLSLEVKRPGREADHSPPSGAEVKNVWSYTSTPHYVFTAWCLVKHRDTCTFTFTQNRLGTKKRGETHSYHTWDSNPLPTWLKPCASETTSVSSQLIIIFTNNAI